jgi:dTDP-4-dehydrorhamnose 3,5-epimerase
MLWIPEGFAHGFCVLGDRPADVVYNVNATYAAASESGILFDDSALGIEWPIARAQAIISPRDTVLPTLAQAKANLAKWFAA